MSSDSRGAYEIHEKNRNRKKDQDETRVEDLIDGLLYVFAVLQVIITPYTKVEESFNLQAIHDILYHGTDLDKYDHHEFPGVVPRTFLGPIAVSVISFPVVSLLKILRVNKFYSQYAVRIVLSMFVIAAFKAYKSAVKFRLGANIGFWLSVLTVSQFHFLFYSSRPLPNTFALVLVLHSLAAWLKAQPTRFIFFAAASVLIFRVELAMFFGLIVLMELATHRISLTKVILTGVAACVIFIPLTVLVDSYFWKRLLWPEFEVMFFNVIQNRSSEYGVLPFLWYFYSALPRSILLHLVFVPLAPFLDGRSILLLFPSMGFIFLYSFLPHKELRFIIYTVPVINTVIALAIDAIWKKRLESRLCNLASVLPPVFVLGNLLATCVLTYVSHQNYPGGLAIHKLHRMEAAENPVSVHISVAACQTGVSRFTQEFDTWKYDKTENLSAQEMKSRGFSHLIMAAQSKEDVNVQPFLDEYVVVMTIDGYAGVHVDRTKFPPARFKRRTEFLLLKRMG